MRTSGGQLFIVIFFTKRLRFILFLFSLIFFVCKVPIRNTEIQDKGSFRTYFIHFIGNLALRNVEISKIVLHGPGPRGYISTLVRYMVPSAGNFAIFMGIGSAIRREERPKNIMLKRKKFFLKFFFPICRNPVSLWNPGEFLNFRNHFKKTLY
jgi:hypothetical protein